MFILGHDKVVDTLIRNGADVNLASQGYTPLFAAAQNGNWHSLKIARRT